MKEWPCVRNIPCVDYMFLAALAAGWSLSGCNLGESQCTSPDGMTGAGAGIGVPYSDCLGRIARAKIGTGQGCPSACSPRAVLAGQLSWVQAGCSTLGPHMGEC